MDRVVVVLVAMLLALAVTYPLPIMAQGGEKLEPSTRKAPPSLGEAPPAGSDPVGPLSVTAEMLQEVKKLPPCEPSKPIPKGKMDKIAGCILLGERRPDIEQKRRGPKTTTGSGLLETLLPSLKVHAHDQGTFTDPSPRHAAGNFRAESENPYNWGGDGWYVQISPSPNTQLRDPGRDLHLASIYTGVDVGGPDTREIGVVVSGGYWLLFTDSPFYVYNYAPNFPVVIDRPYVYHR